MQVKSIELCNKPPAFFAQEPVFRVILEDENGKVTRYFTSKTQHEAEIRANRECVEYMKRQQFSGEPMNITHRRVGAGE